MPTPRSLRRVRKVLADTLAELANVREDLTRWQGACHDNGLQRDEAKREVVRLQTQLAEQHLAWSSDVQKAVPIKFWGNRQLLELLHSMEAAYAMKPSPGLFKDATFRTVPHASSFPLDLLKAVVRECVDRNLVVR